MTDQPDMLAIKRGYNLCIKLDRTPKEGITLHTLTPWELSDLLEYVASLSVAIENLKLSNSELELRASAAQEALDNVVKRIKDLARDVESRGVPSASASEIRLAVWGS